MEAFEINNPDELPALGDAWRRLWRVTPRASFFQSFEWFDAAWRNAGVRQTLRVIVVGDRDNPIGIVPLIVRHEQRRVAVTKVLTWPLDDWGSYYGPISDRPELALRAAIEHVASSRRDWDLLDLRWTPPGDQDPAKTVAVLESLGLRFETQPRHRTSLIDLDGTWDEYVASRSKNWRSSFRRRRKRLLAAGEVRYERYRPAGEEHGDTDPRWDLYDACLRLAEASWQGASETGNTLTHDSVRDHLRAAHEAAARLGCLDLNLLYLDDRPVAYLYNYVCGGRVFALRTGFDPEMTELGVGSQLEAMAVEDSFARGDSIYELGPDAEDSKRQLRTRLEPVWQYTHYPRFAVRSQLMRWKSAAKGWWPAAPGDS